MVHYQQQTTETATTTAALPDPVQLVMCLVVIHSSSSGSIQPRGNISTVSSRRFRSTFSRDGGVPAMVALPIADDRDGNNHSSGSGSRPPGHTSGGDPLRRFRQSSIARPPPLQILLVKQKQHVTGKKHQNSRL